MLAQSGDKLLRMRVPTELENPHVESVVRVAGGARLNVTISGDPPDAAASGMWCTWPACSKIARRPVKKVPAPPDDPVPGSGSLSP